jgi:hypothetical protein
MMQSQPQIQPETIAKQCFSKLNEVTFPDLATRQLFEKLIQESATPGMDITAYDLGQQRLL